MTRRRGNCCCSCSKAGDRSIRRRARPAGNCLRCFLVRPRLGFDLMASNKTYRRASDLPDAIPLFPLAGAILLPGGQLPLNIFEPRYLAMFDDAMRGERIIGMIQPAADADAGRASARLAAGGRRRAHHPIVGDRRRPLFRGVERHSPLPGRSRKSSRPRLIVRRGSISRVSPRISRRRKPCRAPRAAKISVRTSTSSPMIWPRRCGSKSPARISKPCPILT